MIHGVFNIDGQLVPNSVVDEGENSFLKMLAQGDNTIVAAAANFYFGLCSATFDDTTILSSLAGEPAAGVNGYARQGVARSAVGWPTLVQGTDGRWGITTVTFTFTATGAGYGPIQRIFMCSVSTGSAGKLFCLSAPLSAEINITVAAPLPVSYTLFL